MDESASPFQETRWSLIARVREGDSPARTAALQELAAIYWRPVYSFLRTRGLTSEQAADATQGFFADVILARDLLASATGGRLRALILAALKNYVIDLSRRADARGARVVHHEFDIQRAETLCGIVPEENPDSAFERNWVATQVQEALRRTEAYCRQRGHARHWAAFEARHIRPACSMVGQPPFDELWATLGYGSKADAAAGVQFVRKRMLLELQMEQD
jgi:hypothetical protein